MMNELRPRKGDLNPGKGRTFQKLIAGCLFSELIGILSRAVRAGSARGQFTARVGAGRVRDDLILDL